MRCQFILLLFLPLMTGSAVFGIDVTVEAALVRSTLRLHAIGTNAIPEVTSTNVFQFNVTSYLSQEFGENLTVGGSVSAVNMFRDTVLRTGEDVPAGTNLVLQPRETDLQIMATYSFWNIWSIGLAYNLYASLLLENEPSANLMFSPSFNLDWFSLSASLNCSYYFSIYGNGFGASLTVQPQFTIPAWALSIGFPVGLGLSTEGYKNSDQTGLDTFSFSVSVQWMIVTGIALTGSFGFSPSVMLDPGEQFEWGEPNFQAGVVFLILS